MKKSRELIIISITIVLGILLPFAFHFIKAGGIIFLPMYYPIIISGFLISPGSALIAGFLTPLISAVLTGMPPLNPPIALQMSIELLILGFTTSFLFNKFKFNYYIVSIFSILLNRVVFILMGFIMSEIYDLPFKSKIISELTVSLPGIFIMIFILPVLVKIIKTKLIRIESIYE
ncbi:ECF transporter S component [Candidatus Dependentiae bacterium]|nr:ECF transporter S component [Candidatus Dependentiae bacterium]